jgi:beta-mannosidase
VVFYAPVEYIENRYREAPLKNSDDSTKGSFYLRKAHCMFGWDWGPKLPDMGIWRSISIRGYKNARIEDVYITQNHLESKVELDVRISVFNRSGRNVKAAVKIIGPDKSEIEKTENTGENPKHIRLDIENPKQWWPNGFGEHPLYTVEVFLLGAAESEPLDSNRIKIGLRSLNVK